MIKNNLFAKSWKLCININITPITTYEWFFHSCQFKISIIGCKITYFKDYVDARVVQFNISEFWGLKVENSFLGYKFWSKFKQNLILKNAKLIKV